MARSAAESRIRGPLTVGIALVAWLFLLGLTVWIGLSSWLFELLLDDESAALIAGALLNVALLVPLVLTHWERTRDLFAIRSKTPVILGAVLVVAGALVPLHYHLSSPVGVYLLIMPVSVLWQDYITFGLLQGHLRQHASPLGTVAILTVAFTAGHLIWSGGFYERPVLVLTPVMAPVHVFAGGGRDAALAALHTPDALPRGDVSRCWPLIPGVPGPGMSRTRRHPPVPARGRSGRRR